jgi:quercetin dioxygenase-like cupin family protein
MTLPTLPGERPAFPYAGQPVHIPADHGGQSPRSAVIGLTIPAHFAGPIPHAHDEFDEAIYVLSGRLLVYDKDERQEALPGSMFVASRGHRHGFSNPPGEVARVLGLWAPPEPALAFMREIGAALSPDTPPDPDRMREIYTRHASRLLPDNPQLPRAENAHQITPPTWLMYERIHGRSI